MTLLIYKERENSLFAQPSRNWAAGSCAFSSMERHGWWQSLAKLGLPCFWNGAWCFLISSSVLFLILFFLSLTHRSAQRTTLPTDALRVNLACHFASRQLPMRLCTGAVILLTWFCNGAYLFLIFIQRDKWLLYLQVSTVFNPISYCQADYFLFFRFGSPTLQHSRLLPVGATYHIFSKYFRLF